MKYSFHRITFGVRLQMDRILEDNNTCTCIMKRHSLKKYISLFVFFAGHSQKSKQHTEICRWVLILAWVNYHVIVHGQYHNNTFDLLSTLLSSVWTWTLILCPVLIHVSQCNQYIIAIQYTWYMWYMQHICTFWNCLVLYMYSCLLLLTSFGMNIYIL